MTRLESSPSLHNFLKNDCRFSRARLISTVAVRLTILGSGSSGNCAYVETEQTRILIDAGFSLRQIRQRLASIGRAPENLTGILITHEHSDHVGGLPVLGRNKDLRTTFYLTRLTEPAIDWGDTRPSRVERFQAGSAFAVGDIEVQSFSVPHDARDPVGFCFRAQGVRVGIATDLGYVTESIKLGTGVLPIYSRTPAATAQQAATIDDVSDGRLTLGIGVSHRVTVEHTYGLSYDRPARHMREYLDALVPLLHDGAVDSDGETISAHAQLHLPGAPTPTRDRPAIRRTAAGAPP